MLVKRRGYFVFNRQLHYKDVFIEWDMDLDDESKLIYVQRVKDQLGELLRPCIDISGATDIKDARFLSCNFVKANQDESVKKMAERICQQMSIDIDLPGIPDYIYLTSLRPSQLNYILHIRCFFDVFRNPDKPGINVARSCALYQMLYYQNKLDYLKDLNKFVYWCLCNTALCCSFTEHEYEKYLKTHAMC